MIFVVALLILKSFSCYGVTTFNNKIKHKDIAIIVDKDAQRSTFLASRVLSSQLMKIGYTIENSDRRINNEDYQFVIYLGMEWIPTTVQAKIKNDGSFYILKENSTLYIAGRDDNYSPREPSVKSKTDFFLLDKKWDTKTKDYFDNPYKSEYLFYNKKFDSWAYDLRGTINGVFTLLEMMDFRWYYPSNDGVIVGNQKLNSLFVDSIYVPRLEFRSFNFYGKRYSNLDEKELFYQLSLKQNQYCDFSDPIMLGHGMRNIHSRSEKKKQDNLFGIYNGKRDNYSRGFGKPCLNSKELFDSHVNYIGQLVETYNQKAISIMPTDSYGQICSCNKCKGNESLDRGYNGSMSNYVWNYCNNLAKVIAVKYPEVILTCYAYGSYLSPPSNLHSLSPNLQVGICRNRYKNFQNPKNYSEDTENIIKWYELTQKPLIFWDYYTQNQEGSKEANTPIFFASNTSSDLNRFAHLIRGETIEVDRSSTYDMVTNHYNVYFTSRKYWNQSTENERDLYFVYMFGEASEEIKSLYNQIEATTTDSININYVYEKLIGSLNFVDKSSLYFYRLNKLIDYIKPLYRQSNLINKNVNQRLRPVRVDASDFTCDGNSIELFWSNLVDYRIDYGYKSANAATIKLVWSGDQSLIISLNNNSALLPGESFQIELETPIGDKIKVKLNHNGLQEINPELLLKPNTYIYCTSNDNNTHAFELKLRFCAEGCISNATRPNDKYPWYLSISKQYGNGKTSFLNQEITNGITTNFVRLSTKD